MLIALDDETEKTLRRLAKEKYGDKKGAISEMVKESIEKITKEQEWQKARDGLFASMEKGYNLGTKGKAFTRDEMYD